MTTAEALKKLKAQMQEAVTKKKKGLLGGSSYTYIESTLNSTYMSLQVHSISITEAEGAINSVQLLLDIADDNAEEQKKQTEKTTASGIMTQEEYETEKKKKYQDYKAGKITNYAYIQWKKQNNPANQTQTAAVPTSAKTTEETSTKGKTAAETPKKGLSFAMPTKPITDDEFADYYVKLMDDLSDGKITQAEYNQYGVILVKLNNEWKATPAQTSDDAKISGSKATVMTEEEYKAAKSEMYQKYKNGEITNYAYIQWKKKNDPSKQQNAGSGASTASTGTNTGATKEAAKKPSWTAKEHNDIYDILYEKKEDGTITDSELTVLVEQLNNLEDTGSTPAEAKKIMQDAVQFIGTNGMSPEDAVGAAKNAPKDTGTKSGISEEQFENGYENLIFNINDLAIGDSEVTYDDANELFELVEQMKDAKVDPDKAEEIIQETVYHIEYGGTTAEEVIKNNNIDAKVQAAINEAKGANTGATVSASKYQGKLLDEFVHGKLTESETNKLSGMVEYLINSGLTENEIDMQLDAALSLMKDTGFDVDAAMNVAAGYKAGISAAVKPITEDELLELQNTIAKKISSGELDQAEGLELIDGIDKMHDKGKTLEEVKAEVNKSIGKMTHDEYIGLWEELNEKKKNGLISEEAYKEKGAKLDALYKQGTSLNNAVSQIGLAKATSADVTSMSAQLFQKTEAGTITYDEFNELQNKAISMQAKGATLEEIKAAVGLDEGTMATEAAVADLSEELKKVYGQAAKEMQAELSKLADEYTDKSIQKYQDLQDGKITKEQYDAWVNGQQMKAKTMQAQIDQMAEIMNQANKKAMGMVNDETYSVFAENANFQSYQITKDTGVNLSFAIYDETTVKNLVKNKPELLPRKTVDKNKDKGWNQEIIAKSITTSILKGEDIRKTARRIANDTASTNMKSMIRYARTAMTSAQNAGRQEMLFRAKDMGIGVKKRWLATLDGRTRHAHAKLDGQTVDVDKPFSSDFGEIMYPGDMSSKGSVPGNLYNCRCTLIYEYDGYPGDPSDNMRRDNETGQLITDMNYDEWKAATDGTKLNELNTAKLELADIQKQILKNKVSETKKYSGIWKDDVTLADYEDKKDSIAAKKDYYDAEIAKYEQAMAEGKSWATQDKIDELKKKQTQLEEFETNGELLAKRNKALKSVQDIYDEIGLQKTAETPNLKELNVSKKKETKTTKKKTGIDALSEGKTKKTTGGFASDAWDESVKKAALNFYDRYDADKVLRPDLDALWDTLTDAEKYAVWEYTRNSNPMNRPLSGYNQRWGRSNYQGIANVDWNHESQYYSLSGYRDFDRFGKNGHAVYKDAITYLTNAIEKSELKKGIWLTRGSDEEGLAGMMEGGGMDFYQVKSLFNGRHSIAEIKKALVGQTGQNNAFTSTGISKDAGFSGNIKYSIYAPAGTKAIYAEPQSYYGNTSKTSLYKKKKSYSTVGGEAEIIVQRGTRYRITDVKKSGSTYEVVMEIVEQPDYFTYGDENTYNGGKTRQKN